MARRGSRRTGAVGFVSKWVRRVRRLVMLAGVVAAVYSWWQQRSGGAPGGVDAGRGDGGPGGGGGSGRRAPIGGPSSPSPLRAEATPEAQPEPVDAPVRSLAGAGTPATTATETEERAWAEPLEGGACPASHPIKANDNSGIYHLPGGRNYDRTRPERCYATAEAAEADGYRRART